MDSRKGKDRKCTCYRYNLYNDWLVRSISYTYTSLTTAKLQENVGGSPFHEFRPNLPICGCCSSALNFCSPLVCRHWCPEYYEYLEAGRSKRVLSFKPLWVDKICQRFSEDKNF